MREYTDVPRGHSAVKLTSSYLSPVASLRGRRVYGARRRRSSLVELTTTGNAAVAINTCDTGARGRDRCTTDLAEKNRMRKRQRETEDEREREKFVGRNVGSMA